MTSRRASAQSRDDLGSLTENSYNPVQLGGFECRFITEGGQILMLTLLRIDTISLYTMMRMADR